MTGKPLYLLVQRSAALLIANRPKDGSPYFGCFSGGKDSIAIKELARIAGVPVIWHYHNTTIDPPELVRYIREHHRDVVWDKPRHGNLFHRVEHKGLPTRFMRWCCDEYKEVLGPKVCKKIIGVRCAESQRRAARYTSCTMPRPAGRTEVLPIRLWQDEHVWQFIHERKLPYCCLYDEGFNRLGCVGCPLPGGSVQRKEFERWPRFRDGWLRAARRFFVLHPERCRWASSGDDLFEWWLSGKSIRWWENNKRQIPLPVGGDEKS